MNKESHSLTRTEKLKRRGIPAIAFGGMAVGATVVGVQEFTESIHEANVCTASNEAVTVQPGDSKWSIAKRITEAGDDVRDTMVHLADVNEQLTDPNYVLQSGDTLSIPVCGPEVSDK